eukprot:TRINITY_DN24991_c0_g3_i1.p1 TRINITY_DN24991_c0_g3~~TRINITY_DN24991_c0_g3_i1.p1  ORF type:complete len:379 (+),score=60.76 TRINITY_DN24991_c0_g3_i1:75-1139(+)
MAPAASAEVAETEEAEESEEYVALSALAASGRYGEAEPPGLMDQARAAAVFSSWFRTNSQGLPGVSPGSLGCEENGAASAWLHSLATASTSAGSSACTSFDSVAGASHLLPPPPGFPPPMPMSGGDSPIPRSSWGDCGLWAQCLPSQEAGLPGYVGADGFLVPPMPSLEKSPPVAPGLVTRSVEEFSSPAKSSSSWMADSQPLTPYQPGEVLSKASSLEQEVPLPVYYQKAFGFEAGIEESEERALKIQIAQGSESCDEDEDTEDIQDVLRQGQEEFHANSATNVGSRGHLMRMCKPCAFFNTKGCKDGIDCKFCHLCEPGEKKRRKKEKSAFLRTVHRWQTANTSGWSPSKSS